MLNGLQVIVFVAGFVAGIMACGAMLRFEEEFQVSNSVTGVCYMLAYALGCCCLLALMKLAHKFALLKPPFDMILSQSLLLVSFGLVLSGLLLVCSAAHLVCWCWSGLLWCWSSLLAGLVCC